MTNVIFLGLFFIIEIKKKIKKPQCYVQQFGKRMT